MNNMNAIDMEKLDSLLQISSTQSTDQFEKVTLKKQIRNSVSDQFILLTLYECGGGFSN